MHIYIYMIYDWKVEGSCICCGVRFVPGAAPELREGFDELLKGRSGRGSCIAVDDA